ncbi:hypothetical protein Poli38472_004404 [Pythium oligandrum]|uniref:F-box domain-containing protein n=1 Tax=Pythium oligandrum TaxID=41045 RepID=A0A8K1CA64_PYTOL|nr:hypothetical protein Poli38472_004404 [Pythium oligandrum]|eukprot:TMW59335.1 hypothetical protein Poli38472_004404 [Pythium oligandrum]
MGNKPSARRRSYIPHAPVCALPDEVLKVLAEYLVGVEVFALSHVNQRFYRQLSAEDVWATRVQHKTPPPNLSTKVPVLPRCWQKQAYAQSRCIVSCPWNPVVDDSKRVHEECATMLRPHLAYTVDIWFCVLPETVNGIKFVDVHCSVNHQVTVRVPTGIWCHLGWKLEEHETVYFNGREISQAQRTDMHYFAWNGELRSNFLGLTAPTYPYDTNAYFALHGVIYKLRFWPDDLYDDVTRLSRLESLSHESIRDLRGRSNEQGRPNQGTESNHFEKRRQMDDTRRRPHASAAAVDALPDEIVDVLAEYLVGVEAFALSHVNRSFYRQLSGEDVWAYRIRELTPPSWHSKRLTAMPRCWQKQAYAQSRCILSLPLDLEDKSDMNRAPGSFVTMLHPQLDYTLDVWFCVPPQLAKGAKYVNVYCSINQQLTVRIKTGVWCHLAWVLDEFETVYLNGKAIAEIQRTGMHHFTWDGELRSNFFGFTTSKHTYDLRSRFAMHGLIHSIRYWSSSYSDRVEHLALFENLDVVSGHDTRVEYDDRGRPNQGVFCSQPQEMMGVLSSLSRYKSRARQPAKQIVKTKPKRSWWQWCFCQADSTINSHRPLGAPAA